MRNRAFGLIAAGVYAISPVSVIYGQSFMNEAAGVFLVVLALYAFLRGREDGAPRWWITGILAGSMAIVSRINSAYLFLPVLFLNYGFLLLAPVFLTTYFFARYCNRRIGGYTGDCLGATQQLCEITFYLGFVALWKFI